MKRYSYTIIRPGGNDTCLVDGIIKNPVLRKRVNDGIMTKYPTVEQVGFVNLNVPALKLMMAGGEFCGNATRSAAWLALNGKPGEVNIKVSGVNGKLKAGVTPKGESFAQMPVYKDFSKITTDGKNRIVEMEGITLYINFNVKEIERLSTDQIKRKSMTLIRAKNLDRFSAAGIIWSKKLGNTWRITPVVYVRKIDTLFIETACGSGTTALGLVLALRNRVSINDVPIIQPTGSPINVSVEIKNKSFGYTQISGPIQLLTKNTLTIE